ncbi:MAG: archaemetzincin family Zn-dependent metalloprotease [Thermodesulfovibrionia bacterium]|nr:archaemetzincin family Zn-dependent metalloprotease [Thermodesulfovibrionia bacterium]
MSSGRGIVLVAIGTVDNTVIEMLKHNLSTVFNTQVIIGKDMAVPGYAFSEKRKQYWSTAILHVLLEQNACIHYKKILGIVDRDLYVPDLNFVFGEAGGDAALISLTRLRQEFHGLPEDSPLFLRRTLTEAVHELGHTYGLRHCSELQCVMFFSNTLRDTDRKGPEFCPPCKSECSKSI